MFVVFCVSSCRNSANEVRHVGKNLITDRLALFAHSVCIKPNFQGLLWDEFDGLGEDELKVLFLLS